MPVVHSRVPYHSTTAGVLGGLGEMILGIFQAKEFERQKKLQEAALAREEEDRKRAQELSDFNVASRLRELAESEAEVPIPGERPVVPEGATMPVQTRTGGALSAMVRPPGAPPLPAAVSAPTPERVTTGTMTAPGEAPVEEATIPALTFRGKVVAPARKVPKLYMSEFAREAARRKREEAIAGGAIEVTPELHETLPPALAAIYKVGSVIPPSVAVAAVREGARPSKSPWSQPFTGPDGLSYQRNTETDAIRRTPGVGRKVEKPAADEFADIPGADWSKTGEEFLKTIPVSTRGLVKKLGDYEANPATLGRAKNRQVLIAAAAQYNPDYNDQLYTQRRQTRMEFTSGKGSTPGSNIIALNTAVQHLGKMSDLSEKLAGGDVKAFNQLQNYIKTNFAGSPDVTNFNTAATAVESELASLLKKAGATDQEIEVWRKNFADSMSKGQLQGAVATALDLMKGRADALQYQWHLSMGENASDFPIYGTSQRKVLSRLGYGGAEAETPPPTTPPPSTAKPGETRVFPDGKTYRKVSGGWVPVG